MDIIYNNKGVAIYKQVVAVIAILAVIVLIILLKRTASIENKAPKIEEQAKSAGIDLNEFK